MAKRDATRHMTCNLSRQKKNLDKIMELSYVAHYACIIKLAVVATVMK